MVYLHPITVGGGEHLARAGEASREHRQEGDQGQMYVRHIRQKFIRNTHSPQFSTGAKHDSAEVETSLFLSLPPYVDAYNTTAPRVQKPAPRVQTNRFTRLESMEMISTY